MSSYYTNSSSVCSLLKKIILTVFFFFLLLDNGIYAATFHDNLGSNLKGAINNIVPQQDNKLIVGGAFSFKEREFSALIRLNLDGTEDTEFSKNLGATFLDPSGNNLASARKVAIQSDGKILAGGRFAPFGFAGGQYGLGLVRVNSNGTDDTSFRNNIPDMLKNTIVYAFVIQSDGKIVVTGRTMTDDDIFHSYVFIIRLNKDGSEDATFKSSVAGIVQNTNTIMIQPDGKILVGGYFNSFNGSHRGGLIRLNSDGTEDLSFAILTSRYSNMVVEHLYVQLNGKIVTSGNFIPSDKSISNKIIIRFNRDGTEDLDFTKVVGDKYRGSATSIMLQSDGKILMSGLILDINGISRNGLIRLNSDGTEDSVFYTNLGKGFGDRSTDPQIIGIQNDGKILIGRAYDFNGNNRSGIVRLNADGTEDISDNLLPPPGPPRGAPRGGPVR